MALINKLTAIADAIRSVTGDATPLTLDDMVTEIKKLGVVVTVYGQPVADSSVLSIANGETVQFGVKLSEEPTQNQTITIISDNDLLTFDRSSLTWLCTLRKCDIQLCCNGHCWDDCVYYSLWNRERSVPGRLY